MVTKFDKYWTDIQGLMGITTLLDPRFKTTVLLICYEDLLGISGQACEDNVNDVKNLLADLMREYHVEEDLEGSQTSTPIVSNNDDYLASISACVASRKPANMGFKSELDRYLDEEMLSMQTKNFNVSDWWKVAGTRYPTLRMIARDIYAIPVTTVASESVFSTGGEFLVSIVAGSLLRCWRLSCVPKTGFGTSTKVYSWFVVVCRIHIYLYSCLKTYTFVFLVDDRSKKPATFWSCLQDTQEGLQVILSNLSLFNYFCAFTAN
jgi:hypothetical protein